MPGNGYSDAYVDRGGRPVGVPHVGPQELDTAQIVPELVLVPQPLLALTRLW